MNNNLTALSSSREPASDGSAPPALKRKRNLLRWWSVGSASAVDLAAKASSNQPLSGPPTCSKAEFSTDGALNGACHVESDQPVSRISLHHISRT